jgi:NADH:ubiquinone oxidoreductase subunit 2 (subunit N)
MLASSIAHAGYMLMGVVAALWVSAMLIYLLIYSFMQLGASESSSLQRDVIGDD